MGRTVEFVKPWRRWFIISGVLVVLSLGLLVFRGLNFGVDFTGGTQMNLNFSHPVTTTAIKAVLDRNHLAGSTVVFLGKGQHNTLITTSAVSEGQRSQVLAQLRARVGPFQEISTNRVSSIIGRQTEQRAVWAVLLAIAAIILYMTIRFEWRFALAGIATMLHDVLITLGAIALIHIQLSQYFIMAVLTIFGYSITDKIIVFDRIRENLPKQRKTESLEEVVNRSLNQVLMRSIYTSATVLLALAALLIFAGSSIRDFSLTMFIGVAVGTYSSIFIASPLWMLWRGHRRARNRAKSSPRIV